MSWNCDDGTEATAAVQPAGLRQEGLEICDLSLAVLESDLYVSFALPHRGLVTIGRGAGVTIDIPHPTISRRHALLRLGQSLSIEDLGSASGTYLRNQRLAPHRAERIHLGEAVRIGGVQVVVVSGHRVAREGVRTPDPSADLDVAEADGPLLLDPKMRELDALIRSIAAGSISVLLMGETGTGKEVLAERIHTLSRRRDRPFLRLCCASFSEALLESEMFGHEKGAFTGAERSKPGLLETARGGTVMLDEAGEMPGPIQAKLLRMLEERAVRRVGGLEALPIDVRFISATNRDLEQEVERGCFRRDLFYRLGGVVLEVPPLRERRCEIEPLANRFIASLAREAGLTPARLSPDALERLRQYVWPGNVRELRNVIERALLLCHGDEITADHLPAALSRSAPVGPVRALTNGDELRRITEALKLCGGNQTKAARLLGVSRGTLVGRLNEYGLPRPRKIPRLC
jgi:DNA-binding NtrC family response regulator